MKKDWLDWTALVLVIIGGFNWGFYAFGYDLIELFLGTSAFAKTIYVLIGLAAGYMIYFAVSDN
ncbi:MAG: DUF378 domain-containing protein [archaeon]